MYEIAQTLVHHSFRTGKIGTLELQSAVNKRALFLCWELIEGGF